MTFLGKEWSNIKGSASRIYSFIDPNINLANVVTSHFTYVPKRHFRGHQEDAQMALSSSGYLPSALQIRLILLCFFYFFIICFRPIFFKFCCDIIGSATHNSMLSTAWVVFSKVPIQVKQGFVFPLISLGISYVIHCMCILSLCFLSHLMSSSSLTPLQNLWILFPFKTQVQLVFPFLYIFRTDPLGYGSQPEIKVYKVVLPFPTTTECLWFYI